MNALQDIGEVANHECLQEGKEKNVCFIFSLIVYVVIGCPWFFEIYGCKNNYIIACMCLRYDVKEIMYPSYM